MYGYQTSVGRQLGNTVYGDGAKYAGAGDIQLTGKENAQKYGDALGVDLVNHPELRNDPQVSAAIFAKFWTDHDCQTAADAGNWTLVRRKVNGGTNGLTRFIDIVTKLLAM
jgi:putative chitinase